MTCVLDTTMATAELIEKFEPYYKILKKKMSKRINVQFVEHNVGDSPLVASDYLCMFFLVDDGKGNPGLTLEKGGEIISIEEELEKENNE